MAQFVGTAALGGDQYLEPKGDATYSTVHDSAGYLLFTQEFSMPLGQGIVATNYYIWRFGWIFNTSSIPSDALISSAKISFMLAFDFSDTDFDITVVSGADIADGGLVQQDYGDLLDETVSRGSKSTAGLSLNTYYDIDLNATGIGEITRAGITKFGVRSSRDIGSNTPIGDERVNLWSTQQAGRGVKLTVNYDVTFTAGYIWTEGDKLHFISEEREQELLGADTTTNATAGHLFVEGNYLHWISQNGDERRQAGKDTGDNGTAGHIWIDDMWIFYVDSNGNVRRTGTWILGSSKLGVDTILHAAP